MSTFGLERIFAPRRVAIVGGAAPVLDRGHDTPQHSEGDLPGGRWSIPNMRPSTEQQHLPIPKSLPFVPDLIVVTAPAPAIPESSMKPASAAYPAQLISSGSATVAEFRWQGPSREQARTR